MLTRITTDLSHSLSRALQVRLDKTARLEERVSVSGVSQFLMVQPRQVGADVD